MWDQLEVFFQIAKAGNISKAAQNLNVNQSSVSRTLMSLEHNLGYALCSRGSQGIKLTRNGEEILKVAETMVSSFNFARKKIEENMGTSWTLRLYFSSAAREYLLSRGVLDFKRLYPEMSLEIISSDETEDMMLDNIDIAILPKIEDEDDIYEQKQLVSMKPKLFCSPKYIEKFGMAKRVKELPHHSYVVHIFGGKRPCLNQLWFWELNKNLTEKNIVLISNSKEDVFQACREGYGIMSSFADEGYLKDLGLMSLPIESKKQKEEYLIIPKSHCVLPKIQKFREFLKEKI